MFEFLWLWVWVLLPLPLIVYYFVPSVKQEIGLHLPYLPETIVDKQPKHYGRWILLTLIWLLLLTAASRPVWFGDPIQSEPERRDLMLVVDLSGSMQLEDMRLPSGEYIDRLSASKMIVSQFVAKRKGDRMGLTVFADHAYLQTPLTSDLNTVKEQLQRMVIGLVGTETAIGEGLGIAIKNFIDTKAKQRVIVLLTDGRNNRGAITPDQALSLAKANHVKIYTIGLGADRLVQNLGFGMTRTVDPSDIDEGLMTKLANETGGHYFRARDPKELENIYQEIEKLEPIKSQAQTWRPQFEYFHYPLGLALLLSCVLMIIRRYFT